MYNGLILFEGLVELYNRFLVFCFEGQSAASMVQLIRLSASFKLKLPKRRDENVLLLYTHFYIFFLLEMGASNVLYFEALIGNNGFTKLALSSYSLLYFT